MLSIPGILILGSFPESNASVVPLSFTTAYIKYTVPPTAMVLKAIHVNTLSAFKDIETYPMASEHKIPVTIATSRPNQGPNPNALANTPANAEINITPSIPILVIPAFDVMTAPKDARIRGVATLITEYKNEGSKQNQYC